MALETCSDESFQEKNEVEDQINLILRPGVYHLLADPFGQAEPVVFVPAQLLIHKIGAMTSIW